MFYVLADILPKLNENDRRHVELYIKGLEDALDLLTDERNYLRGQIANAIRSMKFDLHPELPRKEN